MSTTNPPKSSGSSLEQAGRKQQNLPLLVAVFLLLHAVVLGGILWVGCKPHKEDMAKNEAPPPSPIGGGLAPIGGSNTSPFFEPLDNSQSPAAPGPTPSGPPAGPIGPPPAPATSGISAEPIPPPSDVAPSPTAPPASSNPGGTGAVMPAPAPPPPPPPGSGSSVSPTPTPAPAPSSTGPAPAPTSPARTHTVGRGDTYYSIAREYKTTMNAMKEANRGVDPTKLQLGQKIKVPAPVASTPARPRPTGSTHVVKSGDTLGRIAAKHKTTVDKLRAINGLTSDRILVGQVLKLPSN